MIEILAPTTLTKAMQVQLSGYLGGDDGITRITRMYKEAARRGDTVTNEWKDNLLSNITPPEVFGNPLYRRERWLEGIGTPFWMTMGRDPFASEAFKDPQKGHLQLINYIDQFRPKGVSVAGEAYTTTDRGKVGISGPRARYDVDYSQLI